MDESNAKALARSDFRLSKESADPRDGLFFIRLARMRNTWVAYHAGASWMTNERHGAKQEVARLAAEVERLRAERDEARQEAADLCGTDEDESLLPWNRDALAREDGAG